MCQQLSPRSPPYTTSGTNPVPPPPPYYPMPLLPPPPFAPSSWPGPSGPFKCHSLSTHLLFRFPVHRLYIHWSRHSLSLPCSFCPSSVLWTSVGQGPLIPSAFYSPPALNYPPPPPYPLYLTHKTPTTLTHWWFSTWGAEPRHPSDGSTRLYAVLLITGVRLQQLYKENPVTKGCSQEVAPSRLS